MYACRRGNVETVSMLLGRRADVRIRSQPESMAMFDAVIENQPKVVRVLLNCKSLDVNATHTGISDRSALMIAAQYEFAEVVGTIIKGDRPDLEIT